jgi:tight adherence protein C
MLIPLVSFGLVFALAAMVWAGLELFREREDPLGDRLEQLQNNTVGGVRYVRRRAGGIDTILYVVSLFPGGDDWLRGIERELRHAGIRQRSALAYYVLFHVTFLLIIVSGMMWFQRDNAPTLRVMATIAALLLGWLIPPMALQRLVKRYRQKLQDALPDTVDMLGIVLGTGLALDQAIGRVTDEMQFIYPELSAELTTVVMQVRAGQERSKAFDQLVRRTGIEDIKSLSAMIVQSERFGTSLSVALKVYADSLRDRRRQNAEAAVAKAGIKMVFPIVLFILPALFVVSLVPAALSFLSGLRGGLGAR